MGISVADNFKHLSKKFLDDRESFDTLADMKAVSDSDIPEGFETYCKATDKRYKFLSTNTVNADTGKWREVEYGGGGTSNYPDLENKPQIEGVTLTGNKTAADLGLAKASDIPTVPTKTSDLTNDSGFITSSSLPGTYAGSTAGLVPAAGSDNEGKYLDNDGNWTVVPMPMIGTINRSDIYDTTEKVVGKWTDGRPLYQKTFTGTMVTPDSDGTSKTSSIDISSLNIKDCCMIESTLVSNTGTGSAESLPATDYATVGGQSILCSCLTYFNTSSLTFKNSLVKYGGRDVICTLYYTKTTDAANSYNYADENDYSTSEKIIGKWIDGKTLYQKTFTGTLTNTSAIGTETGTAISIGANIDKCIEMNGVTISSNGAGQAIPSIKGTSQYVRMVYEANAITIKNAWYTSGTNTYMITVKYTKS